VIALRGTRAAEGHDIMERAFRIGCSVVFFDSLRQPHEALVTNWFHGDHNGVSVAEWEQKQRAGGIQDPLYMPCCNLVYVTTDESKHDPYGAQLERSTSTTYGRQQYKPFVGMCWCWPDEVEEAIKLAAVSYQESVAK